MKSNRDNKSKSTNVSMNFSPRKSFNPSMTFLNNQSIYKNESISKIAEPKYLQELQTKYAIKDNSIPFEEYTRSVKLIMNDYKYEGEEPSHRSFIRRQAYKEEKEKIRSLLNKNKKLNLSSLTKGINDESLIRINVSEEEFKNPFQSLNVLKKNQIIFQSVMNNYSKREDQKFEERVSIIKDNSNMVPDLSKIKITPLLSNNIEIINANNFKLENSNVPQVAMISYVREKNYTELYAYYIYCNKNFPEGREQFCWCSDGNDHILFGGIVSNKSNIIWCLDPIKIEWKKIIAEGTPANLRYGHTGVLYQRKLYVFGGKTKMNNYFYIPDLEIFSLDDRTWTSPILYTKSTLKLRRNHVAKVIGNQMLIHGGISEEDEFLNDVFVLSFQPLKWQTVFIGGEIDSPTLAWHCCCLVLPNDQMYSHKLNIYKLPEQNLGRRSVSKIKEKGLYFFGGKASEGNLKNDVWILKIGKKPLEWIKLNTNGTPPCPRYAHSMNFYEDCNCIIIHGGRNDNSNESFALNDTYLLELSRFDWIRVDLTFDSKNVGVYNRCSHSSIIYTNKLIIFGGMNSQNYIGASLLVIDLGSFGKTNKNVNDSESLLIKKFVQFDVGSENHKVSTGSMSHSHSNSAIPLRRLISTYNSHSFLPQIK